jgi:hypothetical protein
MSGFLDEPYNKGIFTTKPLKGIISLIAFAAIVYGVVYGVHWVLNPPRLNDYELSALAVKAGGTLLRQTSNWSQTEITVIFINKKDEHCPLRYEKVVGDDKWQPELSDATRFGICMSGLGQ